MAGRANELEREIFGGSGSELSEDENDFQASRQQPDAGAGSSGGESEDDYVQSSNKKAAGRSRKPRDDSQAAGHKRKRRAPQRKEPPPEVNLDDLPPQDAARYKVDQQIDAALKPKKTNRPRKRKGNDEVLDSFADDEVARLRETMNAAADEDIKSKEEKAPAVAKLRLLPEVMQTMRKASLAQSIIDNNLLDAVKRWLEPLPDRSLPALNIQRDLFDVIKRMDFIDAPVLKESGLGRIVLFYTKCRRVNSDICRIAEELVRTWSRPVIKRSSSWKDKVVPVAYSQEPQDFSGVRLAQIMENAKSANRRTRTNAVEIPFSTIGDYTVAPSQGGAVRQSSSIMMDTERRKKNAERMRSLTRKVTQK